ncbi:MAG: hypothetical protein K9M49_03905 [Candidatus Marinimicrobia bacterium]|nr:hypothetical protein [Candidatus Neomarinimicrobiota bacterium]
MVDQGRWFSDEEIAVHIGVKKDTVYKWVTKKAHASPHEDKDLKKALANVWQKKILNGYSGHII